MIKAGGGGCLVDEGTQHPLPWLQYRRLQFDARHVKDLVGSLKAVSLSHRVIFAPGGMGAYLFIGLGRELQLHEASLAEIGCQVVNTTGQLVLNALGVAGADVCPQLVDVNADLQEHVDRHGIVVVRASTATATTDSLAACAATKLRGAELLFMKKGVPVFHLGFDHPTELRLFPVTRLLAIAASFRELPGSNPILDGQCLQMMCAHRIPTLFVNSDDVVDLPAIIESPRTRRTTEVEY